uniref:Uncharacterized protein n=1 Tax=Knipowitschia caucasica TaxID=637954 RepID=A0AAV2J1I1_KNICA
MWQDNGGVCVLTQGVWGGWTVPLRPGMDPITWAPPSEKTLPKHKELVGKVKSKGVMCPSCCFQLVPRLLFLNLDLD